MRKKGCMIEIEYGNDKIYTRSELQRLSVNQLLKISKIKDIPEDIIKAYRPPVPPRGVKTKGYRPPTPPRHRRKPINPIKYKTRLINIILKYQDSM